MGSVREPAVADAELVAFERRVGQVAQRKIVHCRQSLRTVHQMPGPCHVVSPPLFLRRAAFWSEKPLPLSSRPGMRRSEEHTSELQSLMRISYAVFCLKKKITTEQQHPMIYEI